MRTRWGLLRTWASRTTGQVSESCLLGKEGRSFPENDCGLGGTPRPPLPGTGIYLLPGSLPAPLSRKASVVHGHPHRVGTEPQDPPPPPPALPNSCFLPSPFFYRLVFSHSLVKEENFCVALENVDTNTRVRGQRGDG